MNSDKLETVIIFGPTGKVGAAAAQKAHSHGAKVVLAMRDTHKSLPGIDDSEERNGNYQRVRADLMDPSTIQDAVSTTGARRAFIYLMHEAQDGMQAALKALKTGGIEFVVFLSSCSIDGDAATQKADRPIPFAHAQVELSLAEHFPSNFAALRAGYFAINTSSWAPEIKSGNIKIYLLDTMFDYVSTTDVGEVAGSILAHGLKDEQTTIPVLGPQMLKQREAAELIGKVLQQHITVVSVDRQQAIQHYTDLGYPRHLAVQVVEGMEKLPPHGRSVSLELQAEGAKNVERYTGRPAMSFEDWLRQNVSLMSA